MQPTFEIIDYLMLLPIFGLWLMSIFVTVETIRKPNIDNIAKFSFTTSSCLGATAAYAYIIIYKWSNSL